MADTAFSISEIQASLKLAQFELTKALIALRPYQNAVNMWTKNCDEYKRELYIALRQEISTFVPHELDYQTIDEIMSKIYGLPGDPDHE